MIIIYVTRKLITVLILIAGIFGISTTDAANFKSKSLYPGEQIRETNGYPNLVKFIAGKKSKPLVILVPGNSHLARIFYGFPKGKKSDFLCFWLQKLGYPILAISYPLENSVYKETYPNYSISDWSRSIVKIAKHFIKKDHLKKQVVIVAWSMGGELSQKINTITKQNNIHIKLFVGLSASQPLYNLLPTGEFFDRLKPLKNGLAKTSPFFSFFENMLIYQNKINKHNIIPKDIYQSQFIGNCPINIMGTSLRYKKGVFVRNITDAITDTGALHISNYPPIAILHGSNTKDLAFTLFSKHDWGSLIMRHYYSKISTSKNKIKNQRKAYFLIKKTPDLLVKQIKGSHFFFVGKYGAKRTAKSIDKLIKTNNIINKRLLNLCH